LIIAQKTSISRPSLILSLTYSTLLFGTTPPAKTVGAEKAIPRAKKTEKQLFNTLLTIILKLTTFRHIKHLF
jgi:hypothetical protein